MAAGKVTFAYDGNSARLTRVQNGATTYYVTGSNGELLLEHTPSSGVTVEHVYFRGKRVATKTLQ